MSDPIAAANALANALDTLRDELAESNAQANARLDAQTTYGRRNRRMIWVLVGSVVFELLLTVVIAFVAVQAGNASDKATRAHDQQVATCQTTNEARANNKKLWDYLLDLPPATPRTSVQDEQLDSFRAYVGRTFAPRDCTKI
jgi:hypothetical protein